MDFNTQSPEALKEDDARESGDGFPPSHNQGGHSMAGYIVKRLILLIVTLLVIMTFSYFVMTFVMLRRFEPRDPFWTDVASTWETYWEYLKLIVTEWDWGVDRVGDPVWETLQPRMWLTLRLNIVAFLFYTLFGIFLGIVAAFKHKRLPDKLIQVLVLVLISVPPYVMISVLRIYFGSPNYVPILPPYWPPESADLSERIQAYVLPVFVTSAIPLANITRIIRGELRELFMGDYLLLLKVKGLRRRQVVRRHLLKDATVSMMPEIPNAILYALVSSFIVEIIYGIDGASAWLFHNIFLPFMNIYYVSIVPEPVTLIILFYCFITLGFIVFIDIFYRVLDPRMRVGEEGNNN